ncbi:MAG: DUF4827 domain-containing protein [Muribaculaceae bacterium]|nr:DUF4827 domain-containing protein [Muribaculaceae bacterium]
MRLSTIKSLISAFALLAVTAFSSCSDGKSYAELLNEETESVNYFLAGHRVINEIPADTVFEYGPDAPYYRIEKEGNLYMQVIDPGTKGNMAKNDELLYFRYLRYNLNDMYHDRITALDPDYAYGNADNMVAAPASFRFENYTITAYTQWGIGIQQPLYYLPIDCHVNIVIKSQYGMTDEIGYVVPFVYNIRYFRPGM